MGFLNGEYLSSARAVIKGSQIMLGIMSTLLLCFDHFAFEHSCMSELRLIYLTVINWTFLAANLAVFIANLINIEFPRLKCIEQTLSSECLFLNHQTIATMSSMTYFQRVV